VRRALLDKALFILEIAHPSGKHLPYGQMFALSAGLSVRSGFSSSIKNKKYLDSAEFRRLAFHLQ
jgi:hypothetical protein